MKVHPYTFLILLLILAILPTKRVQAQTNYIIIRQIKNDKILYIKYDYGGEESIDISDLIVWDGIKGKNDVFNRFYYEYRDLRKLLLEKGYAKLKDSTNAESKEIRYQNRAKSNKLGMWYVKKKDSSQDKQDNQPSSRKSNTNQIKTDWSKVFSFLWKAILTLSSLGVIGWVVKSLYKTFYIKRKLKLLIIGEPSTGKTALLYNLVDPKVPKSEILKLEKSKAVTRKTKLNVIPRGKFEIVPELSDVPGSAFATVWDTFLGSYNHALVIVVSPYRLNGLKKNGTMELLKTNGGLDQRYIDIQLGYVQAYIEGGLGAKSIRKPKILIMFISKFDLYCKYPPDDSAAQPVKEKVFDIFKEHINSAKSATKKAGVPFEIVVGSSVEKWNTQKVMDHVTYQLYKI